MRIFHRHKSSQWHPSADALLRWSGYELPAARKALIEQHLDQCEECQTKNKSLEDTLQRIAELHQSRIRQIQSSPARREQFIRKLDTLLESGRARPRWKRLLAQMDFGFLGNAAPPFVRALLVICLGIVIFSVWRWKLPPVSASELLDRAVASDRKATNTSGSGVICRRFRIETTKKTIERAVYSDSSGRCPSQRTQASAEDVELAARLALAGVNWEDPLSAISFKNWHDRQVGMKDEVRPLGEDLLTIRTLLPLANIAQESLTVRKKDFHPVERTIVFRQFGTVEISEVSLNVLSWERVSDIFFEPGSGSIIPAPVRRIPAGDPLPSQTQMDEAELRARLILNQHSADTGEQIDIARDVKGIHVRGLVETEERKKELEKSLQGTPFLIVGIRSFEDLKSVPISNGQVLSAQQQFTVARVSPLEQYFAESGRSRGDLSRISAGLFNSSLAINRTSRSIGQIVLRFSSAEDLSQGALLVRDELLSRTVARLLQHLDEQERLLQESGIAFESLAVEPNPSEGAADFVRLAERNMAATRELVSDATESSHSEKFTATELAETISQLRSAAISLHAAPLQGLE